MRPLMAASLVVGAAFVFGSSAQAATVTALAAGVLSHNLGGGQADFESQTAGTPGTTAPPAGTFTYGDATFTGNGMIMIGTTSGLYAEPFHDTTQYLTVQPNGPTETVSFSHSYGELGLYWGSIDTYNSIVFWKNGSVVDTVLGQQAANAIPAIAAGEQTSDQNNRFILINSIVGGSFDKIVLTSTANSFELDNLTWGPPGGPGPGATPLPAALPLFASGLGGIGLFGWAKKRKKRKARA